VNPTELGGSLVQAAPPDQEQLDEQVALPPGRLPCPWSERGWNPPSEGICRTKRATAGSDEPHAGAGSVPDASLRRRRSMQRVALQDTCARVDITCDRTAGARRGAAVKPGRYSSGRRAFRMAATARSGLTVDDVPGLCSGPMRGPWRPGRDDELPATERRQHSARRGERVGGAAHPQRVGRVWRGPERDEERKDDEREERRSAAQWAVSGGGAHPLTRPRSPPAWPWARARGGSGRARPGPR
jgi:hypothetical protein